jgi:hypothetical protein
MGRMAGFPERWPSSAPAYTTLETIAPLSDDPPLDLLWLERIPIRLNRLANSL